MKTFVCPFCGAALFPADVHKLYCGHCHSSWDMAAHRFVPTDRTPSGILETRKFIDTCLKCKPLLAMGTYPMFHQDFVADDVRYLDSHGLPALKKDQVGGHVLLYGNGVFHYDLFRITCIVKENGWTRSPFELVVENADTYIFNLLGFKNMISTYKVTPALLAYCAPTVETLSAMCTNLPMLGAYSPTDEQLVYTATFLQPQKSIIWDPDDDALMNHCKQFLFLLTSHVPSAREMPFVLSENMTDFPDAVMEREEIAKSIYDAVLSSNVATAPNRGRCAYDILENTYATIKGPGPIMLSRDITAILDTRAIFTKLFEKYAEPVTSMGLGKKRLFLPDDTPDEEVVFEFWERVNAVLRQEGFGTNED